MRDDHIPRNEDMSDDDEIDVLKILSVFWDDKLTLLLCVFVSIFISIFYLHVATYQYTAQIKIYPVQSSGGGFSKQLGGLASLANIDLPTNKGAQSFDLYSEEIYAREVADELSAQTDLMKVIFRSEWDSKNARWRKPSSFLTPIIKAVKTILGVPIVKWQPPNGGRLQEYIQANVSYEEKPKKVTVTISYDNKDPIFAVKFVNAIYKATDDRLRERALERSEKYIGYLHKRLETTTIMEYRAALVSVLSDQEKLNMIASSNVPYSADSLGGATVSLKPTKPNFRTVLALGIFVGFFVGLVVILARYYLLGAGRLAAVEGQDPAL